MSLQKGIIETIEDKYTVKVRVPKFDRLATSTGGVRTKDLSKGIICTLPGVSLSYSVGDVVLVDFENDELSKPVILGTLYRESDSNSILSIDEIDKKIDKINEQLNSISCNNLHTHIKYSNNNGLTFTSLYEYMDVEEETDSNLNTYYFANGVIIHPDSKAVYWSIIDSNNVDVTDEFYITTTINGGLSKEEITHTISYKKSLIEIPIEIQSCDFISIDFKILKSKSTLDDYHISLITDKNPIGTTYGDYIGICISTEESAPNATKEYSWSSFTTRDEKKINDIKDDVLPRIEANERVLYGKTKSNKNNVTNKLGLLDAISVTLDSLILGLDKEYIYFGENTQYVDVSNKTFFINQLAQGKFLTRTEIDDRNFQHYKLVYKENLG